MRFFRTQLQAFLAALVLLSVPAFGQLTSGNITGTIYDPTGATIPGATVIAHNVATGVDSTTTATGAGSYRFENLPIGTYNITVNAPGFTKAQVQGVNVQLNITV